MNNFNPDDYYSPDELPTIKERLAGAFLLFPFDIPKAIASVEPRITHHGFLASLQYDKELNELMRSAKGSQIGSVRKLPTKEEFAQSVWTDAEQCRDKETKLDFLKLFASVMGYVEKPASTVVNNNNNVDNRKVIMLPATQPIDEWSKAAQIQQTKLIENAG